MSRPPLYGSNHLEEDGLPFCKADWSDVWCVMCTLDVVWNERCQDPWRSVDISCICSVSLMCVCVRVLCVRIGLRLGLGYVGKGGEMWKRKKKKKKKKGAPKAR